MGRGRKRERGGGTEKGSGEVNGGGETKVRGERVGKRGQRCVGGEGRQFSVHYIFTCVNYFLFRRTSRKAKDNFSAHNFHFMS